MMVTFISQCEKNALKKTRRVLDSFANRIGDNAWQTVITEEGLFAVKKLIRKTASKNTAVSCHWIRSRSRSDLLWVVGNRGRFNSEGVVPVNSTQRKIINSHWENDWKYLPFIKALTAVAALFHDWGKASYLFQKKLKSNTNLGDPLRHEWISCLLLKSLINQADDYTNDASWLSLLIENKWDEQKLKENVLKNQVKPLENLPPLARLVSWLIVTHHRLPSLYDKEKRKLYATTPKKEIQDLLKSVTADWGYQNKFDNQEYQKRLGGCFQFPHGLLKDSDQWKKQITKWSKKLLEQKDYADVLLKNGAWRVVLHHARLCLMLGDHYYSSCDADSSWVSQVSLFANTDNKRVLKQKLDEHLVKVSQQALVISQSLSRFATEMECASDIQSLKKKSPREYVWQDKAVDCVKAFRKQHNSALKVGCGWFVVNMASTGCGKTIANAKIMRALSDDGETLRYLLALGLRTLTLQTGDEYKNRIGLQSDELAVLIGSRAIQELHEKRRQSQEDALVWDDLGSESAEELLGEDLDYSDSPTADFLKAIFPTHQPKTAEKNKAFLYKPVLVCTIDHIISATETTRGGKYILPCLRLLSSDLVIDEVDDFDGQDLIAIGRLIHLAGMLGRKVMISSATIPPALAEGFFHAYQEGWRLYSSFKQIPFQVTSAWVDEFSTQAEFVSQTASYEKFHKEFIFQRVEKLNQQQVKRKGSIIDCDDFLEKNNKSLNKESLEHLYFEKIKKTVMDLHDKHHTVDPVTKKKLSFGVIRVANIAPCVALTQYLLQQNWNGYSPKIMAYHSRQVLLLRHEQERHLDVVLKRKEKAGEPPHAFQDPIIRRHLNTAQSGNVIFILVATPVEEVGRDHDFDWAIIEPSSYRSIIQLSGRVRRHRSGEVKNPNVVIMQYNLRGLKKDGNVAFRWPGYETAKTLKLNTHDLKKLIDENYLSKKIDAIPRIQQSKSLEPKEKLSDLEHQAMINSLKNYTGTGPNSLQGWLAESWWMTALPQQFNRFRESSPDIKLFFLWKDNESTFYEKTDEGNWVKREAYYKISKKISIEDPLKEKFWLVRSYETALRRLDERDDNLEFLSKRYGEITFPQYDQGKDFLYSDQFGLYRKM